MVATERRLIKASTALQALMQECFWWPGITRDLRNCIKKCSRCRKYEAAPPVAPMKPLACSEPGELLHVDFTSIEETVSL